MTLDGTGDECKFFEVAPSFLVGSDFVIFDVLMGCLEVLVCFLRGAIVLGSLGRFGKSSVEVACAMPC